MTTRDGVEPEPTLWLRRTDPVTDLSIRELVAELALAEEAMRERPGAPEPSARLRALVIELRRRRARMRRLHLRSLTDGSPAASKEDGSRPPRPRTQVR
ncbi:MAG: hypothetical protein ACJ715_02890 [Ornithinibacter sp.]